MTPNDNDAITGFPEGTRPTDATLIAVKEMLRRAWLTLLTIENTSCGPRSPRTAWPAFPRDHNTAYDAAPAKVQAFTATAADRTNYLDVLSWFAWFMNPTLDPKVAPIPQHVETVKIFKGWCCGVPTWLLQHRMTTNRRQPASKSLVYKRIDTMVYAITMQFAGRVNDLLRTFHVDRVSEVDQNPRPSEQAAPILESDLLDLPISPRYVRAPSVPYDHPDALAARESARVREEAEALQQKRASQRQRRQHGQATSEGAQGSAAGTSGSRRAA
jgi:hypothetical protein